MLTRLTPVARLSDMQCEVIIMWGEVQAELISYSANQLHAALNQRKVLSEIGQVCGEITKTFIFV